MKGKTLTFVAAGLIALGVSSCSTNPYKSPRARSIAAFFNNEEQRFRRFSSGLDSLCEHGPWQPDSAKKRELFRIAEELGIGPKEIFFTNFVQNCILANPEAPSDLQWPPVSEERIAKTLSDSSKSVDPECPPWVCPQDRPPGDTTKYKQSRMSRLTADDFRGLSLEQRKKLLVNHYIAGTFEDVSISGGAFRPDFKKKFVGALRENKEEFEQFAKELRLHCAGHGFTLDEVDRRLFVLAKNYGLAPEDMVSVLWMRITIVANPRSSSDLLWPPDIEGLILKTLVENIDRLGSLLADTTKPELKGMDAETREILYRFKLLPTSIKRKLAEALIKRVEESVTAKAP